MHGIRACMWADDEPEKSAHAHNIIMIVSVAQCTRTMRVLMIYVQIIICIIII